MKLTIDLGNEIKSFDVEKNESSVWKVIGKVLSEAACPSVVTATIESGEFARFKVTERGTWTDDDGAVYPSRYIVKSGGNLGEVLPPSKYAPCYLACIHPLSNNYKAYMLEQLPSGEITAKYESIDAFMRGDYREIKDPYPSCMYWVRYFEKISKGYRDQSDVYFGTKTKKQKVDAKPVVGKVAKSGLPRSASEELYQLLFNFAHNRVSSSLVSDHVTERQVAKARSLWKNLCKYKTVKAFNKHLQDLLLISPRKRNPLCDSVMSFLARDTKDFAPIIDREENLILAMEALIGGGEEKEATGNPSFKDFNIEVFEANEKQRQEVFGLLGDSLKGRVKRIWRVKPLLQEKRFAKYCKERNIRDIRKLWHGSRNENWASIIKNSLLLNPNAVITGKMFGKGIYFAPSPSKSFNYTSCYGTYWAHGKSNCGYMGVYATAYGRPHMVTTWGGDYANECRNKTYDCVHATSKNTGLRSDEIVFYDEAAMCLNYLVEFAS